MSKKDKEDEIIKFFKETSFYKDLNDNEIDKVINIIKNYASQPREVLILKIAELAIKGNRHLCFY